MSVCHTLVLNQNEHYRFCTYTESSIIDQFNKQSAAFCHSEMTLTMHKQTNKQTGKQNLWVDFNKKVRRGLPTKLFSWLLSSLPLNFRQILPHVQW